jgi:ribulose-phosphate 3-epimerase
MLTKRICPSILAGDFMRMGDSIKELESVGCDYIHMDVMDGRFVPAITFGEKMIADASAVFDGIIDAHLMIEDPSSQYEALSRSGAETLIFHLEENDLQAEISKIDALGAKAGIAIDGPTTGFSHIESVLRDIEVVLIATGKVGKAGQAIDLEALKKVSQIRQMKGGEEINIMVDIGINMDTIDLALEAGANWFVVSSGIFKNPKGIGPAFKELQNKIGA